MQQWNKLAKEYGLTVLSQKYILWPNLIKRLAPTFRDTSVLDIGCGNGAYSHYFYKSGARVVGIDSSKEQIKLAKKFNSGPSYVNIKIQDYNSKNTFDNFFANMVVCNMPDEKELKTFFSRAFQNAHPKSRLFVTDVSPRFKRTCKTVALIHHYPDKVKEGTSFSVELPTENGQILGPFTNYHWSKSALERIASSSGWNLCRSMILRNESTNNRNWPNYILYEFARD